MINYIHVRLEGGVMDVLDTPVFVARGRDGAAGRTSLAGLLDRIDRDDLADLPTLPPQCRAPMRSVLAALLAIGRRHGGLEAVDRRLWRATAPDAEPAFFQAPTSGGALERLDLGDVGLGVVGVGHACKGAGETDDPEPRLC
jgi:hypothetical protein